MINYLLQLSGPLSLLLIVLLLLQQLFMRQLGARTVYALWASVPLLLLLSVTTSLLPTVVPVVALQSYKVEVRQLAETANSINWLFVLWLSGALLCISYLFACYLSSAAILRRAVPVTLKATELAGYQSDTNNGPYISGFVSPSILIPNDFFTRFSAVQQQLILRHELTHWQRGDLHFNWLALAIVCLFWFNPLCWLGYQKYRQAQELACDAVVIATASSDERIAYGYALLSSAQQPSIYGWPLTHHYGDFDIMKQRITQLQNQQGLSKTLVLGAMALVIGASLFLQQPALAGASNSKEPAIIVRVEPRYPIDAAKEGITGYVQLKFDIDTDGSVFNVKVIKASPKAVFDAEAEKALLKWRYAPKATVQKDNLIQLDFQIDELQGQS